MSHFAMRCFRGLTLRAAKNAKTNKIVRRALEQVRPAPISPRVPTRPPNFLLLLTTVFAASEIDQDDSQATYISPFDLENVTPIKKVSDLENMISDAGEKLVVIFCMVRWCPFCRRIAPTVEDIAANGTQDLVMLKLDMDDEEAESTRIVARYGAFYEQQGRFAVGLPTFVFLRSGSKLEHFSSADDGRLRGAVRKYTALWGK